MSTCLLMKRIHSHGFLFEKLMELGSLLQIYFVSRKSALIRNVFSRILHFSRDISINGSTSQGIHQLHPITDPEIWDTTLARKLSSLDFAFCPTLTKTTRYQDAMLYKSLFKYFALSSLSSSAASLCVLQVNKFRCCSGAAWQVVNSVIFNACHRVKSMYHAQSRDAST